MTAIKLNPGSFSDISNITLRQRSPRDYPIKRFGRINTSYSSSYTTWETRKLSKSIRAGRPQSFVPKRDHRVHLRRPPRRDPASDERHSGQQSRNRREGNRIPCAHTEE